MFFTWLFNPSSKKQYNPLIHDRNKTLTEVSVLLLKFSYDPRILYLPLEPNHGIQLCWTYLLWGLNLCHGSVASSTLIPTNSNSSTQSSILFSLFDHYTMIMVDRWRAYVEKTRLILIKKWMIYSFRKFRRMLRNQTIRRLVKPGFYASIYDVDSWLPQISPAFKELIKVAEIYGEKTRQGCTVKSKSKLSHDDQSTFFDVIFVYMLEK